ncbi:hypothetical protein DST30_22970 [Salmonella enterica subsp. enterica serovar Panama]|nr:hypothetical protein [Salmonella enterica subsp. enterica serovar Panama]
MSIKERIQQLIETNQQRRTDEIIEAVEHALDQFEYFLNEDTWDTDFVNGKTYLQKTVSMTEKLQFLKIGITDDEAVIQAALPFCLSDVDWKEYKSYLTDVFRNRTDVYEFPIRLEIGFPNHPERNTVLTLLSKEIAPLSGDNDFEEKGLSRITSVLLDVAADANRILSETEDSYVQDYSYGPLRRVVVTREDNGFRVIGMARNMSVVNADDLTLKHTFETRLQNCASRYGTTVTFVLCFHPSVAAWVKTVIKEDRK